MSAIDGRAALPGILGGLIWLVALAGFVFGEIEYQDPTRPSPIPEWASALCLSVGAVLIAAMLVSLRRWESGGFAKASITVALAGTALALVPLWPMIFFGPLLVALGMAARGLASIRRGDGQGASWLHAVGIPLALVSGMAFDAVDINNSYSGFVFAFAVCGGLIWLGYDMLVRDRTPGPLSSQVRA